MSENSYHTQESSKILPYIKRRCARLAFVQAIFQIHMTGQHFSTVMDFFIDSIIKNDVDGFFMNASRKYFCKLMACISDIYQYDEIISNKTGREICDLDNVSLAIIRAAIHEKHNTNLPTQVVINEYIEISKSFFDDQSKIGLINAVLDSIFFESI